MINVKNIHDNYTDMLFQAVLSLRNINECRRFFTDLCSIAELRSMSQRLEVAQMLRSKHIYNDIAAETNASTATISRVNKSLVYGQNGYNLVLDRITEDKNGKL